MARYVLVHGAWHGSWCFRELADALEARGHEAIAVDLPCEDTTFDQWAYARLIGAQPGAFVVGHSLAGQTIPHVEAGTRVYLAAVLPVAGAYDAAFVESFGGFVRDELDRSYWPDADTCAAFMYPDCTRERSDWAFARLRHQARIAEAPAPFGPGDVVIATMRDAAVDGAWQAETGRAHGARVIELDAGHSPFFTQPDELAGVLHSLA